VVVMDDEFLIFFWRSVMWLEVCLLLTLPLVSGGFAFVSFELRLLVSSIIQSNGISMWPEQSPVRYEAQAKEKGNISANWHLILQHQNSSTEKEEFATEPKQGELEDKQKAFRVFSGFLNISFLWGCD
jgi:hypothetical protein